MLVKFLLFLVGIAVIVAVFVTKAPQIVKNIPISLPTPTANVPQATVIAKNLDTPWAIAFLPASPAGGPDGSMLVTERPGKLDLVDVNGNVTLVANISESKEIGEGGLLGIALSPNFSSNHYIYLYYTYRADGINTFNKVSRMTYQNGKVSDEKVIVDNIPGNSNHNGGRIKFGPDKMLYIGTGDAQNPSQAQDINTLGGKILRVTENGDPAPGNPFGPPAGEAGNLVYSYGHRNVQGLAWDKNGTMFATEHGRSGSLSGLDEINLIEPGKNYGWPTIQGNETMDGMMTAIKNSGRTTWAPSGMGYLNGSLFFGGLRGQTLYEAVLDGNVVTEVKSHLAKQFGRLRDVVVGPDGMLYVTTSNRDGRGSPVADDDRIIRINPGKLN